MKTLEYYLKIEDGARYGNAKDKSLVHILQKKGRWPAKPDSFLGACDGLRDWYGKSGQHWADANGDPLRAIERVQDPELLTRHEIQGASPDLLVTNYSMLEYMLLRPIERRYSRIRAISSKRTRMKNSSWSSMRRTSIAAPTAQKSPI